MMAKTTVLTGITTTGTPHLGNYVGAIRPAIASSRDASVDAFFFLADLHGLIKCDDPARIQRSTLEIAATWLALGLDPDRVTFYRQSDVPEITELSWLLSCVCPKGLMNRAHAYKAAVDQNMAAGEDPDHGVTMGLFSYPVLMAADILLFGAERVPVGRDQVQHIEMARDLAQRFNHLYGAGEALLVLPEAVVDASSAVLPGLDGRKMSKSYGNTIPLWLPPAELLGLVRRIVTNALPPGVPKDPSDSTLFTLYAALADAEETEALRRDYAAGIGWGEVKQRLFERIDRELAPARERYQALIEDPARQIEPVLQVGAQRARARAIPLMQRLREAVGLRRQHRALSSLLAATEPPVAATAAVEPAEFSAPFPVQGDPQPMFALRMRVPGGHDLLLGPLPERPALGRLAASLRKASPERVVFEVESSGPGGPCQLWLRLDGAPIGASEPLPDAETAEQAARQARLALERLQAVDADKAAAKR